MPYPCEDLGSARRVHPHRKYPRQSLPYLVSDCVWEETYNSEPTSKVYGNWGVDMATPTRAAPPRRSPVMEKNVPSSAFLREMATSAAKIIESYDAIKKGSALLRQMLAPFCNYAEEPSTSMSTSTRVRADTTPLSTTTAVAVSLASTPPRAVDSRKRPCGDGMPSSSPPSTTAKTASSPRARTPPRAVTRKRNIAAYLTAIGPADVILIASDLKFMTVLTTLALDGVKNKIDSEGANVIAEALTLNTVLTELDLRRNNFRAAGAMAIAEALKVNAVAVTDLNLGCNAIGDGGAMAFAGTLEVNKVLTVLNLELNNIGPDGAKAIAEALKNNTVLTRFCFGRNPIGNSGAITFMRALEVNIVLTELNLHFRWSRGNCGRIAIGTSVLTKLASLASVGTFLIGGAGVQAVREGEEPGSGVWIV